MEKRIFKKGSLEVSLFGMGAMRLPQLSKKTTDIDRKSVCEMVDYALANGVNYFDTAHYYHDGESETVMGEALSRHTRDSYLLATKMPSWVIKENSDVRKIFEKQLQKCQTDYFDFYLCHNINKSYYSHYEKYQIIEFLLNMKKEGKIRFLGFSFHDTPSFLEKVLQVRDWDFAQLQINYLDWKLQNAKAQYELLEAQAIPCIVMEPVRGGALADLCPEANAVFKSISPDKSIASWAIRYAASLPNVLTVLSGVSNMEQLKDNVSSLTNFKPLEDNEYDTINKALEIFKNKFTVPCTACRYCMDCPSGVDIPENIRIANQYALSKNKWEYYSSYNALDITARAESCTSCGICKESCPQQINIPEQMKNFAADIKKVSEMF